MKNWSDAPSQCRLKYSLLRQLNLHIHHFPIVPTHAMSSISSNTPSSVQSVIAQTRPPSSVAAVTYPPTTASSFPISVSPAGNPDSDARSIIVTMTRPTTTISITTMDDNPGDEGTLGAADVRIYNPTGLFAKLGEEELERLRGDVKALYARHLFDARSDSGETSKTFLEKFGQGLEDILLSAIGLAKETSEALWDGITETSKVVTGQAAFDLAKWPQYTIGTMVSTLVILVSMGSVRFVMTPARRTSPHSGDADAGSDIELGPLPRN